MQIELTAKPEFVAPAQVWKWPIASFSCAANFGRYRCIADSGKSSVRLTYGLVRTGHRPDALRREGNLPKKARVSECQLGRGSSLTVLAGFRRTSTAPQPPTGSLVAPHCRDTEPPTVATFGYPPEVDRVKQQPDYDYLQQKRARLIAPAQEHQRPVPLPGQGSPGTSRS